MKKIYIFILIFNIIFIANAFSQVNGGLSGKVIDKINQQPVIGAVIEIISLKLKAGSDDNGYYYFDKIPAGTYSVKYSAIGYQVRVIDNVVINSGVVTDVQAPLDIVSTDVILVEDERFTKPEDITNSIRNLTSEEIRSVPGGFEDVGRVIQTLPGVSFVNDGRNDLIVRGGSPTENLFIVDNFFVPNINHFGSQGATGGPVSIINLNFIRDVNFITGGFSAKYGDKLSSVLDLKLREGSRIKFMGDINLSATGFGAVFEGPIGSEKKGSWLVSARRSYLDIIFNAAGFGFVPEYYSVQGKGTYDINKNNYLTVNFISNYDIVKFNNDDDEKKQDNSVILDNDQYGYVFGVEWKSLLSKKSYSVFNLTRTYTNFDYTGRDTADVLYFTNKSKEGETSLKAEYNLQVERGLLTIGGEGKLADIKNEIFREKDSLNFINPNTGYRYTTPYVNFYDKNTTFKVAAYLQYSQNFFSRLKINAGIRYDYFEFINKKSYISPRFSSSLNLYKNLYLNLSYGIFYQSPSYLLLISNPANKNLEDIRADHYIGGLEYLFSSDLKASVEAYYKKYKNYPVSIQRPYYIASNSGGNFEGENSFIFEELISEGSGDSKGIEFYIQKTLTDNYYFNINFTYYQAKYKSLDGVERNSDFDNRYLFTAFGGYFIGKGWTLSGKFRYAGGRPYTPYNPNGTQFVSEYNTFRLPDYYSIDLRIDKKWNFAKWTLVTYIDIQNITARKNITNYKWNKYKRIVEANESIGVLPSIGINAMF